MEIGTERSRSESFVKGGEAYKANLNMKPFIMTEEEIMEVQHEPVPRVYID